MARKKELPLPELPVGLQVEIDPGGQRGHISP